MPKHTVPTKWCRCGACSYVRRARGVPVSPGIADLPGFAESLRLLVAREEYSLTDIALMFGVSPERIRQLTLKLGVQVHEYPKGERAVRVWDDEAHRFRPVRAGWFSEQEDESRRAVRRLVRERYRQHVYDCLATIPTDHPATMRGVWAAVSGEMLPGNLACARWSSICQVAGVDMTYAAFKALLAQYGIRLHKVGRPRKSAPATSPLSTRPRLSGPRPTVPQTS